MNLFRILIRLFFVGIVLAGLFWASQSLDKLGGWEEKVRAWTAHPGDPSGMTYSGPVSSLGVGYQSAGTDAMGDSETKHSVGFQKFLKSEMPTLGEAATIRPEEAARMAAIAKQKSLAQKARIEEEIQKMESGT